MPDEAAISSVYSLIGDAGFERPLGFADGSSVD